MAKILKRHIRNLLFRFISRNVRIVVHKVISTFNGRLTSSYFVYRQNQLLIISLGVRKSSFLKVTTPSVSITAKHDKQFCTCQVVFARNITYLCLGLFQYLREKQLLVEKISIIWQNLSVGFTINKNRNYNVPFQL